MTPFCVGPPVLARAGGVLGMTGPVQGLLRRVSAVFREWHRGLQVQGAGQEGKGPGKGDGTQVTVCGLEPTGRGAVMTQQQPRTGGRCLENIISQGLRHRQHTANRGLRAGPGSDTFCSACGMFSKEKCYIGDLPSKIGRFHVKLPSSGISRKIGRPGHTDPSPP